MSPLTFIAAWGVLGALREGYSPVNDPISRLAAVGATTRLPMTGAFLVFGAGVALYGAELRRVMPGGAGVAAITTAVASVGIAATPLGSALGGNAHATCAGIAYASLAATPLLGARSFWARDQRVAAAASVTLGLASGASLVASALAGSRIGLFQRTGLTLGDAWIIATALTMIRSARTPD